MALTKLSRLKCQIFSVMLHALFPHLGHFSKDFGVDSRMAGALGNGLFCSASPRLRQIMCE